MTSRTAHRLIRRTGGVAFLAVLLLCGCEARSINRTVDLEPRSGWHASEGMHVRPDGRIYLMRDGTGFVWKQLELDVDEFPVLLFRISDSFSRFRWRVAVQAGDGAPANATAAVPLIERVAEESHYIVPLQRPTGWTGRTRFRLLVVLEGQRRDWLELGDLAAVHLTAAAPAAPGLAAPADGAVLSPNALHFSLAQAPNAVDYELQVSRQPDFSRAWSARVTPPYLADRLPYLPDDDAPREAGQWFWRARAISIGGRAGPWARAHRYTLQESTVLRAPALAPSSEEPLFVLMADRRNMVARWRALPAEVRRHTVFRVEDLPTESLAVTVELAQRHGIPVVVQTSGPHDYYGPVSARIPLSDVDGWFRRFPVVKGVYICEQAFRVPPELNRTMLTYARRLLALAAEYGRLVVWADAHWTRNLWIDAALDAPLAAAMRRYARYFVPVVKMNGALTPYSALDADLGLWLGGFAAGWGVQPEHWYWYEAGLGTLGRQRWHKEGEMAAFPPTFYGQMALLGLAEGATVYSFEPGDDVWTAAGELSPTARGVILPLLEAIVSRRLIAGRADVVRRTRAVYVADSADSPWALDYGTLHPLYEAAYGATGPFAMIPAETRYGRIPIVPRNTPPEALASFPDRLHAGEFATAAEARRHLDARYPERREGDAWVGAIRGGFAIMNSHENQDVDERFDVALEGPVRRVAGRLGVNAYVVLQQREGEAWLQANARPGRTVALDLWAARQPAAIRVTPPSAVVRSVWNSSERRLALTLAPGGAAVDVVLGFPVPAAPPHGGR